VKEIHAEMNRLTAKHAELIALAFAIGTDKLQGVSKEEETALSWGIRYPHYFFLISNYFEDYISMGVLQEFKI